MFRVVPREVVRCLVVRSYGGNDFLITLPDFFFFFYIDISESMYLNTLIDIYILD